MGTNDTVVLSVLWTLQLLLYQLSYIPFNSKNFMSKKPTTWDINLSSKIYIQSLKPMEKVFKNMKTMRIWNILMPLNSTYVPRSDRIKWLTSVNSVHDTGWLQKAGMKLKPMVGQLKILRRPDLKSILNLKTSFCQVPTRSPLWMNTKAH